MQRNKLAESTITDSQTGRPSGRPFCSGNSSVCSNSSGYDVRFFLSGGPSKDDTSSVEAIYGNFCEQIHFFTSREEAESWAEGRENIVILSVEEGYELGKLAFSELLAYA